LARVQAAWENYGQAIAAADLTHIPTDFQHAAPVTPKSETVSMRLSATDTRSLLEALPILYNASTADAILSALVTICCGPKQSLLLSVIGNLPLSAKAPRTTNARSESENVTDSFPLLLPNGDRQSLGTTLKLIKEAVRQVPNSRMGCSIALGNSDRDRYADLPAAEIAFRYDDPLSEETSHENFDPKPSSTLDSFQTACPEKLAIAARLDSGSLCLHWHYSPNLFQQDTVTQLAQQTLQALQDLATHCQASDAGGYTPSDFPLAQLDTPALHKLFGHNRAIADLYPLSPTQEGMLFHTLYSPHGGTYFDQVSCQIEGALDIECFQQAWVQVIQHYDVLRTAFLWQELDRPLQAVRHSVELPWTELDWSDADETERSRQLQAFLAAERERGFDLARAPLMRLTLIHLGRDTYYFVWSRHHLLLDGWSLPLVMQSMLSAYETLVARRDRAVLPSAPPYRDYIGWLQAQNLDEAKAFWQEYLADWTAPLALDRIGARSDKSTSSDSDAARTESSYAECNIPFAADSSDKLNAFTRQHRLTLNTLVQGVWSLLLAHYSGELDIVFGATVAGRPTELMGIETTAGLFINTLPVGVRIADDASLLAWLQQLQTAQVEGNRYAYSPLAEIQSWSAVPRGRALFETLVVFENYPIDAALKRRVADLSLQGLTNEINNGYPLTLRAVPERELLLQLIYDRDRFDSAVVNAMGEHLKTLLEGAIAQPDIRVGALLQQVRESSQQSFKQARRKKLGQVRRKAIRRSAPTQTEGGN
ncbi:MAG: condensation domain-containing protein, partial [Cyanobacteria bacterium P01_F01_bin.33]